MANYISCNCDTNNNSGSNGEINIYKGTVADYNSISTAYPNPQVGWAVQIQNGNGTYADGEVFTYNGTEWVRLPYTVEDMAPIADVTSFQEESPLSYVYVDGALNVEIKAQQYSIFTHDRRYNTVFVLSEPVLIPWSSGKWIGFNLTTNEFITRMTLDELFDIENVYLVGKMDYVQGVENVYIYGYGNAPNRPSTFNTGSGNIIGVPSTFSITWDVTATTFTMTAGRYYILENVTGITRQIILSGDLTIPYDFSSIIYYIPGDDTFSQAATVAVPTGAVVIGSMNNINGIPTVSLNGLNSFTGE